MNETGQQAIQTEQPQPSVAVETPAEVASGSGSRSEFLQQLPKSVLRTNAEIQQIREQRQQMQQEQMERQREQEDVNTALQGAQAELMIVTGKQDYL